MAKISNMQNNTHTHTTHQKKNQTFTLSPDILKSLQRLSEHHAEITTGRSFVGVKVNVPGNDSFMSCLP